MTRLQFQPFDKKELIEKLKYKFPQYVIQTGFGNLQVRTKRFTLTGNVQIKSNPEKGRITLQTNYDFGFLFLIVSFPIGVYILAKKDKQKQLEEEVAKGIESILGDKSNKEPSIFD